MMICNAKLIGNSQRKIVDSLRDLSLSAHHKCLSSRQLVGGSNHYTFFLYVFTKEIWIDANFVERVLQPYYYRPSTLGRLDFIVMLEKQGDANNSFQLMNKLVNILKVITTMKLKEEVLAGGAGNTSWIQYLCRKYNIEILHLVAAQKCTVR